MSTEVEASSYKLQKAERTTEENYQREKESFSQVRISVYTYIHTVCVAKAKP